MLKMTTMMMMAGMRARAVTTTTRRAASTSVFARGIGINGALGTGTLDNAAEPVPVDGPEREFVKVSGGYGHSAALDKNGKAYLFGRTHDSTLTVRLGRYAKANPLMAWAMQHLGSARSVDAPSPREVINFKVFGIPMEEDPEESSRKAGISAPMLGFSTEKMREVVCGAGVTAFISAETDTLFMLGSNSFGECAVGLPDAFVWDARTPVGLPEDDDAVASVALGFRHGILATKKTGKVFAWGKGQRGQMGLSLRGIDDFFTMQHVRNLPGPAVKVVAGMNSSAALLEDGRVFVWGKMQSRTIDTAKSQYEDQLAPREVHFDSEAGPVVDLWAGPNSFAAMVKDASADADTCALYQWGMLSDQDKSSAESVNKQLQVHTENKTGFWKSVERNALARTVLDPVRVLSPFELRGSKPEVEVTIGHEGFCIVGKDLPTPYRWDWNLRPVPWYLHDNDLSGFLESHKITAISQGWQHTLFVARQNSSST